jgi:2-oxoglutarate ferredoxin oxidoreductase subunit beta
MEQEELVQLAEEGAYERCAARPDLLINLPTHYCPGCNHDTVHRLLAECIEELGVANRTTIVWPIGCSTFGSWYFTHKVDEVREDNSGVDSVDAPHGRATAVATGIKRVQPDRIVITFQGDGDFAAIGTAESVHSFNRGENITVVYINNGIYGMTGGQMSPTTLPHQKTSTSPLGRDPRDMGNPIRMCEMLATLDGTAYAERVAMVDPKHILRTKRAIRKALSLQVDNNRTRQSGTGLVEILIGCPTNWKMTPTQSNQFVASEMTQYFPLGVFREPVESPS